MTQAGYHFCATCGGKFFDGYARESYVPEWHRYKATWQCWPCARATQSLTVFLEDVMSGPVGEVKELHMHFGGTE